MNDENIKKSPFYKEYSDKKNDSFTIHASKEFIDALKGHFKGKYPHMINKKGKNAGKHNLGASARLILEDYLNNQCIERKEYDYSIVAMIGEKQFGAIDGTIGVVDVRIFDIPYSPLIWGNKEHEKYFDKMFSKNGLDKQLEHSYDEYVDEIDTDDVVRVLSIGLNNHLDKLTAGVYTCNDEDSNIHCGFNLITSIGFGNHCIVYEWCLDNEYKPQIIDIFFKDVNNVLEDLLLVDNVKSYVKMKRDLEKHEKKYPSDKSDRLKKEILDKKAKIKILENEIAENETELKELEKDCD